MIQERIAALRIRLASPEQILEWSSGEVTKAETINFRTQKPEQDGLFDERIFGPTRDWTCFCRKYTREQQQQPGLVCEKCGVEVTQSSVRRERLGHIRLAAPVVHPWFARGTPSSISLLLNISPRACASVLSYTDYLVLAINEEARARVLATRHTFSLEEEAWMRQLEQLAVGDYLEESAYQQLSQLCPYGFHADTGAAAIQTRLKQLDLVVLSRQLHAAYHHAEGPAKKRIFKRLSVVEAFRRSGVQPEWMVLTVLPVLPPGLRPLVPLAGNRMVTSDLNELYMRVLHRSDRVRIFEQRDAPAIMLHQEKRMLQQAVEAVLDNAHRSRPTVNARRQPLKCLTALLSGKSGRFRKNLLGKRVDYSGRSVIVGNPALHLHQCGLPKKMACELFKPFLMRKLVDRYLARSVKHAKHLVERRDPVIWDLLAECLFERVVLLNRAPTLHRLSIQAFEPVLVEGSALQLHPQVCSSFNADFDGDQMAVHLPLSEEAQNEARELLLSTHNLRSPASGDPAITISQEQVLGLYYLTEDRPSPKQAGRVFVDMAEAIHALSAGVIDLHTQIVIRLGCTLVYDDPERVNAHPAGAHGRVETTVGRLLFNEALPDGLRYKNYAMTKDALKQLVAESLAHCGDEATVQLCDALKTLGFHYATRSGISFAISDIKMPPQREGMIQQGQHRQQETDERFHAGEISDAEWYRLAIANWTEVTEQISGTLKEVLAPYGSLMTIVKSGATKAKFQQIRQLSGIRGLMASPSGKIIPIPILSNYLLGMSVWEVFIAASGARKGFMDRSLNTAMSGYLTRKLVEVGMSTLIDEADCGTPRGIFLSIAQYQERGATGLRTLLTGRVLAEPVASLDARTQLSVEHVDRLLTQGVQGVFIRSPLTCQSPHGLCQQCYGRDPATGRLVRRGAAVGVIAGQSIGEPGTQLTMRTFHSGGIANAQGDITQGLPRVSELFEARTPRNKAMLAELAGLVQISSDEGGKCKRVHVVAATSFVDEYPLPAGATLLVNETDEVQAGQPLARTRENTILARYGGRVVQRTEQRLTLSIQECEERVYDLPLGCQLAVEPGQVVEIGTPLTVGAIDPKALLALCGVEATCRYLVSEVQRVYRATGVYISEQHPEIIVRHMLRYVQVSAEGETDLLPGAVLDQFRFAEANAHVLAQGGQPALARPIILGLTRTALQTSSWIAAASFQETPRVLTAAAIAGQCDWLVGLKEKIILGLPIPSQVA